MSAGPLATRTRRNDDVIIIAFYYFGTRNELFSKILLISSTPLINKLDDLIPMVVAGPSDHRRADDEKPDSKVVEFARLEQLH